MSRKSKKHGVTQHTKIAELLASGKAVVISGQNNDIDLDELRATLAAVDASQLTPLHSTAPDSDTALTQASHTLNRRFDNSKRVTRRSRSFARHSRQTT